MTAMPTAKFTGPRRKSFMLIVGDSTEWCKKIMRPISDSVVIQPADDRSFGESLGDRLFSYGLRFYVTR